MLFVTAEDFKVIPYDIPNLSEEDMAIAFEAFVEEQTEEVLIKLFGNSFYDSFIEGLNDLPDDYSPTEEYAIDETVVYGISTWKSLQDTNTDHTPEEGAWWTKIEDNKWLKLQKGDSYIYKEHTQKWRGMRVMLKPYIYAVWTKWNNNHNTGIGIVEPKPENSNTVSSTYRVVTAFNSFVKVTGNKCNQYGTLYGYVTQKNIEDATLFANTFDETFSSFQLYFDANFKGTKSMNSFNL